MQRRQPPSSHTNSFRTRAIFNPVRQDTIRNYFENCAISRNASIKYFFGLLSYITKRRMIGRHWERLVLYFVFSKSYFGPNCPCLADIMARSEPTLLVKELTERWIRLKVITSMIFSFYDGVSRTQPSPNLRVCLGTRETLFSISDWYG